MGLTSGRWSSPLKGRWACPALHNYITYLQGGRAGARPGAGQGQAGRLNRRRSAGCSWAGAVWSRAGPGTKIQHPHAASPTDRRQRVTPAMQLGAALPSTQHSAHLIPGFPEGLIAPRVPLQRAEGGGNWLQSALLACCAFAIYSRYASLREYVQRFKWSPHELPLAPTHRKERCRAHIARSTGQAAAPELPPAPRSCCCSR